MRGQRPTLAVVLAWLSVLVLVLGTLPALGQGGLRLAGPVQQAPLEEGGGEGRLAEPGPAKLRRQAPMPAPAPAAPSLARLDAWLDCDVDLMHSMLAAASVRPDWPLATPDTPWADAPGRRQQRGQAPPRA